MFVSYTWLDAGKYRWMISFHISALFLLINELFITTKQSMSSSERVSDLVNVVQNAVSRAGHVTADDKDFQSALSTTRSSLWRATGRVGSLSHHSLCIGALPPPVYSLPAPVRCRVPVAVSLFGAHEAAYCGVMTTVRLHRAERVCHQNCINRDIHSSLLQTMAHFVIYYL